MDHPASHEERTSILVVDDLEEKILVYHSILDELGLNIVKARSGEEALRQILKNEFAVILLDVQMPGMDGFETAALIRKRRRSMHTPIIFLTAFIDDVRSQAGYAHGAVDYMATPVVPDVLRAKVRVFVDLHRMTQQVRRQAEARGVLALERSRREAAEESNRRLAILARAGAVLGQSLDYLVTAADVARLTVPDLADSAFLVVLRPGERDWITTSVRQGSNGSAVVEQIDRGELSDRHLSAVERILADKLPEAEGGDLVLPLRARGKPFGALILSRQSGSFDPPDVTVADVLVGRAAVALDNARLYQGIEAADRQKNEFLSMLAHELRNPLAPIVNAAEILRLALPNEPQVQWARNVIDRQLNHMVRLVDDLLDVSRITSGKIRLQRGPVQISEVLSTAIEASRPLIDRAGHQFEIAIPEQSIWVDGDAARLSQVATNLLRNAAKYTDPGGRVCLTVECEGETAIISVRDTGIGIPPDMLHAVFELFTQVDRSLDRAQGGLGIGLTLVHRLVTMHGGTVTAASEGLGKGSEFVVRLPTIPSPHAAEPAATPTIRREQSRLDQLSVLVVDDHVDGAGSLAALLGRICREVHVAQTAPPAIDLALTHRPQFIILDIGLPGMNGYELARHFRSRPETRDAVLIAMTGYGGDEDVQRSREAGFDRHLVKPVELVELRRTLESFPHSQR
ncbi:MAG TPA: response regulator [Urbifossiella sp.]|nr:response regulator [Urbifossiella sp.]